ncbi:MAG: polyphosphate polymerase domain-containing protein [Verrucomicrobia bacterium]|nr:polyphosphate polymerase domain-containing protein [Verrucomicrobiota bacterium]
MHDLNAILKNFDPISLNEMEGVKLMDRLDAKFTFRSEQLPAILQAMVPHYRMLEVEGVRANRYETLYFDTDDFALFATHHSGKFIRYKVRFRRYVDSDLCFFEVKAKNNKGRTIKQRIQREAILRAVEGEAEELLQRETPLSAREFKPVLWVHFTRFTFVSKTTAERVTIDLNLAYESKAARVDFPKLVIAEVKQDKSSLASPFIRLMRERRIWQGSMSKYCFGIVNLYPRVKMNLFKERVKQLKLLAA